MINEFYAVTLKSIYKVTAIGEYNSEAVTIANKTESEHHIGKKLGGRTYYMIGIGMCLQSFIPERFGQGHPQTGFQRDYAAINTCYWGPSSSVIVGLFEDEAAARMCFAFDDGNQADDRWLESTTKVLELIGDNHESFFVTHFHNLGLIESRDMESA